MCPEQRTPTQRNRDTSGSPAGGADARPDANPKGHAMTLRIHDNDPEAELKEAVNKRHPLTSPLRAIRAFCVEICMCGSRTEVRECVSNGCPLHAFRLGRNPHRRRELSDEQRERLREHGRRHVGNLCRNPVSMPVSAARNAE